MSLHRLGAFFVEGAGTTVKLVADPGCLRVLIPAETLRNQDRRFSRLGAIRSQSMAKTKVALVGHHSIQGGFADLCCWAVSS